MQQYINRMSRKVSSEPKREQEHIRDLNPQRALERNRKLWTPPWGNHASRQDAWMLYCKAHERVYAGWLAEMRNRWFRWERCCDCRLGLSIEPNTSCHAWCKVSRGLSLHPNPSTHVVYLCRFSRLVRRRGIPTHQISPWTCGCRWQIVIQAARRLVSARHGCYGNDKHCVCVNMQGWAESKGSGRVIVGVPTLQVCINVKSPVVVCVSARMCDFCQSWL